MIVSFGKWPAKMNGTRQDILVHGGSTSYFAAVILGEMNATIKNATL